MSDDDLPALLTDTALPIPQSLPSNSTLSQSKHADVEVANTMLSLCYDLLPKAKSVSSILKIIDTSMSIVERRRKLLCLQYGNSDKDIGSTFTTPLPD